MKREKFTNLISLKLKPMFLFITISCLLPLTSYAADVTWTGPATGDWATASNWSSGVLPTLDDSVTIAVGNEVTLSGTTVVNKISIKGKLIVTSTGVLNVEKTGVGPTPLMEIAGGNVTNAGTVSLTQYNANVASGLNFANGINGIFTNTGTLVIDMFYGIGECVSFNQKAGNTALLDLGTGSVKFTAASTKALIGAYSGDAQIGGTLTIGSSSSYMCNKLINILNANLTLLPSANITAYLGLTAVVNLVGSGAGITFASGAGVLGAINTNIFTNNGNLTIHGGTANGSHGINVAPQVFSNAILTNAGSISIDGTFSTGSTGCITLFGVDATASSTLNNSGTITVNNAGTAASIYTSTSAGTTKPVFINNAGSMIFNKGLTLNSATVFNNNSGGNVKMSASITGTAIGATLVNNNLGGTFNFDVALNTTTALNALSFKNYGTIIGRGTFISNTFIPQSGGIISPGNATNAIDKFTINGTPMDFSGTTFLMDVHGKTTGGADFDQVISSTASAAINMTGTIFNVIVGGSYTPVVNDQVTLFNASSTTVPLPQITGSLGSPSASAWATTMNTANNGVLAKFIGVSAVEVIKVLNGKVYADGDAIVVSLPSDTNTQISITDLTGRMLKKISVAGGTTSLNLGGFKGVCIVNLLSSEGLYTQKVIL